MPDITARGELFANVIGLGSRASRRAARRASDRADVPAYS
jgi:hypothetical protein